MIVDSSALVAVLLGEEDRETILHALADAGSCSISSGTLLEVSIVVDRLGDPVTSRRLTDLLETFDVRIEPFTSAQAALGREAYRDFGKGSGHPAKLDFGDCFAYALSRDRQEPLLFVGDDFSHTDVAPALRD